MRCRKSPRWYCSRETALCIVQWSCALPNGSNWQKAQLGNFEIEYSFVSHFLETTNIILELKSCTIEVFDLLDIVVNLFLEAMDDVPRNVRENSRLYKGWV